MATTIGNIPPTSGGFGSDTIVQLPNSTNGLVNSLELITTLTTNTAGAEVSNFVVKLLTAGAQTTALDVRPAQTRFPDGTQAAPALAPQSDPTEGIYFAANTVIVSVAGSARVQFATGGAVFSAGQSIFLGTDTLRGMSNTSSNITLFSDANMQMGADGALLTAATAGFVEFPSCAGTPTGAVSPRPGKAILVYDTTAHKLWSREGGSWRSVTFA